MTREWQAKGCGVGLRRPHYEYVLKERPAMDWFEAVTENYMKTGGRPLHVLEKVRENYPVALHGTSLSIGSAGELNPDYLKHLKLLVERIDPFIVSDHLCWTGVGGEQLHDLLPLPFTCEAADLVVRHVTQVQEMLGRRMLLENVSTYITYRHSQMTEWEFLSDIARKSGCGILLDLNNIYVNSVNHGFDAKQYLEHIPGEYIGQYHLAGHSDMGGYLFDTHSKHVIDPVWDLYRLAVKKWGRISTLIEWDEEIPAFEVLSKEAARAREIYLAGSVGIPERNSVRLNGPLGPDAKGPGLQDLQVWFRSKVQPFENKNVPEIKGILNPQGKVPGEERLGVYSGGYLARQEIALEDVYDAVRHLTGDRVFHQLAAGYAHTYPSHDYILSLAGRHFPEFLKTHPVAKKLPFLPDLARLEWKIAEAFHAFHRQAISREELQRISPQDWEQARLVFQPSLSVMKSNWPLHDLWMTRIKPVGEIDVKVEGRPQQVMVWRSGTERCCEVIDEIKYDFIRGLLEGRTLGDVCEELSERMEGSVPVQEWFAGWVREGLITGIETTVRGAR